MTPNTPVTQVARSVPGGCREMNTPDSLTVAEIARRLAAPFTGDGARRIASIAPLDAADGDCLSWLGSAKYAERLAGTRAAAVLVPAGAPVPPGVAAICVADPDLAVAQVLGMLAPPPPRVPLGLDPRAVVQPGARVEGTAIGPYVFVGSGAEIGPGTELHPGVYIGENARVGRDCVLWPNVIVRERCRLGDRVIIHGNSTIGTDGFGYLPRNGRHHKVPQVGIVVIGDDVEIGANSCVDRARSGETRIGRGTKIDNQVQVGHNCDIGEDCILVAQVGISGSCTIGRNVIMGGQVGVADHMKIGDNVQLAAGTGIMSNVPPGVSLAGVPGVDRRRSMRQLAAVARLPELLTQVRDLVKRIERLESAKNDQG
ncbi:MAG: UDP-3-O-(3-hydroxymyristoyl)glucosamine N-acyltransferase [Phycisphaerales bacterium]|nr:UDP-3-O-(3-hydroxymyristoyl)glucosamine N-acyltransferase [Phycisphaerales bacterium]